MYLNFRRGFRVGLSLTLQITAIILNGSPRFPWVGFRWLQITAALLILCNPLRSALATESLPNFDQRLEKIKATQPGMVGAAKASAASILRNRVTDVRIDEDEILGSPKFIASACGFLTGTNGSGGAVTSATSAAFNLNDPHRGVKTFLAEHQALFGFGPEALTAAKVNKDYVSAPGNFRTVVWQQHVDDIPIFNAIFKAHLTKNGELINIGSQFVPDLKISLSKISNRPSMQTNPPISGHRAIVLAAENVGDVVTTNQLAAQDTPQGNEKFQHFRGFPILNNTSARLTWLPLDVSTMRLCWDISLESRARGELYRVIVDAATGEVWLRQCLTDNLSDITMNVWSGESPSPMSPGLNSVSSFQPPVVLRTFVTFSALDTNASPAGWINDGNNTTVGNNVDAHLDWDNDNLPDAGSSPAGSPNRVFSYMTDLSQEPSNNWAVAVTSLFYWNNWAHDKFYALGFTEAAGNFQTDNFGRGGAAGDPVQADAQDSYGLAATGFNRNNANFSTPLDGTSPRMQMYIFPGSTPARDGDLDAGVMVHEYTHGVSTRLVGGGAGISALQTKGMGEGWSDFCALSLLSSPTNDPDLNYPVGSYVALHFGGAANSGGLTSNYYFGIRRYPYSINTNVNPLTYKDIDTNQISAHAGVPFSPVASSNPTNANEIHNMGEVWCNTLWEARSRLCHKYGNATGNQMMLQLVIDGMKFSPANPLFLQARDAILQADRVDNGGANQDLLWAAFAKRGMGLSASSPPNFTTLGVGEAFNTPADTNAPILAVTSPANGSAIQTFTNISGTAYDGGSGLQGNQIHFTLYNNGNLWSGTYWTNTPSTDPSVDLTAPVVKGVWTYSNVPTGGNQGTGIYLISAFARDNAGNTSQAQSGVTSTSFTIDRSVPNVAITFPANGSTITNQLGGNWLQGTASDSPNNQLGVSLFIRRNSDNLYWTGSGWGDVTNGFISNTYNSVNQIWQSTGALPVPGSSLANGDYHFIAIAVDSAGNQQQVDSVVSVDFHPIYVFNYGSYFGQTPNMSWNDPANWDTGQVPNSDVIVVINNFSPDATSLGNFNLYGLNQSGGSLATVGVTIQKLNLSGGTFNGALNFPSNGVFNWSGGMLSSTCNIPSGALLTLSGASDKTLAYNSTINQAGKVVWTGAGNLNAGYGTTWNNTGTFSIQGDAPFYNYTGGFPSPAFNNYGILQKTNATGVTVISPGNSGWIFNNNATLNIASGVLSSQNPLYLNNGTVISGAGILRVDASTTTLTGTNTLQPGATFELAAGAISGTNTFGGTGTFRWSGGTILSTLNLQPNIVFSISGSSDKILFANSTVNLAGASTWSGVGIINASYGSVMNNNGNFTAQNDSQFYNYTGGAPLPQFNNNGTFIKTNSLGTTAFNAANGGVAFNNNGSVKVQSGVLTLGGGGVSQNASFSSAPGAELDLNGGAHSFGPALKFDGGLTRMQSGTLTFTGTNALTNNATFEIAGGGVNGTNSFIGTGAFNWSGGTIASLLSFSSGVAFTISGASDKSLSANSTLNLAGTSTWTGSGIVNVGYGSVINNAGNFLVQNDATFYNYTGGAPIPQFFNTGTFSKTNSPGTTDFSYANGGIAFNNGGRLSVRSGSLSLGGGGTSSNDALEIAAGSTIDLVSGAFFFNGNRTLTGPGTNRVTGATVVFNNGTNTFESAGIFEIAGGAVAGTNIFSGTGTVLWSGGSISAALNLQPNIALNLSGGNIKTLSSGGTLTVAGNTLWSGGGLNVSYSSAFINNGLFTAQTGGQFYNYTGGGPLPVFVNNGTFTKSADPAATIFNEANGGVPLNNNGTINLQTGALSLGGGGSGANGIFTTAFGSHIDLANGTFNWNGNSTINGAGVTRVSGATLTFDGGTTALNGTFEVAAGTAGGTNTFAGPGNFNWTGGGIGGNFTLQSNLLCNIAAAGDKTLQPNGTINISGTATWTGSGNLNMSYASSINNSGTFTLQNDASFYNYTGGAPTPVFNNTGTFRKNSATGVSTFNPSNGGVNFNNSGTADLQTGTISISAGYATSPTARLQIPLSGTTATTQFGTENFNTPATFDGVLAVTLVNGFTPTNGQSFILVNYGSRTGQFTSTQFPPLPLESKWQLTYDLSTLVLQVVPSTAFQSFALTNGNFRFALVGQTGSWCLIEASTNLFDWSPLLTNAPFDGTLNFEDPQTPQLPQRFYRATIFP